MFQLPSRIEVQLTDSNGRPVPVPRVLVAVRLFNEGKYYYGDLIGLTDDRGAVWLDTGQLRSHFDEDRRLFPMDYLVDLETNDTSVEFVILSAEEIQRRRQDTPENAMIAPRAIELYIKAENQRVTPSSVRVDLAGKSSGTHRVAVPTALASK